MNNTDISTKFITIGKTNIKFSNIKSYGIAQKEDKKYFIKVKEFSHTDVGKFLFFKFTEDNFVYQNLRIPVIIENTYGIDSLHIKLPDKDYEIVIADNFYDGEERAFLLKKDSVISEKRGFVKSNGGNWKNFIGELYDCFEVVKDKDGNLTIKTFFVSYPDEQNLVVEKTIVNYLYVTTYQNDNYRFFEDSTDIFAEKEKLDIAFSTKE